MYKTAQVFNTEARLFFSYLIVPLLFLPKINLITVGGDQTAGIRFDDIALMCFAALYVWGSFSIRREPLKVEWLMSAIVFFSFFSVFLNKMLSRAGLIHVDASLFYAIRTFEYFIFFYIGYQCVSLISLDSIMKSLFLWNGAIMLLQKAGLIGAFTNYGYIEMVQSRVTGICAFPSETGAVLNLLFCYLLFQGSIPARLKHFFCHGEFFILSYPYLLCLVTACLVILTGSRASLATHFLIFIAKAISDLKSGSLLKKMLASLFLIMGILAGLLGVIYTESLYARSQGLISWENVSLAEEVWRKTDVDLNPMGNEAVDLNDNHDTSWWMRIHKWCYALKIFVLHPENYLFGIGPGFAFAALDGGFLRILVELGVAGFFLHFLLFKELAKSSYAIKWMLLAFALNMTFFDAYLSYKVMALFFFAAGYELANASTIFLEAVPSP